MQLAYASLRNFYNLLYHCQSMVGGVYIVNTLTPLVYFILYVCFYQ